MLIATRTTPRGALLHIPISLMFVTLLLFFFKLSTKVGGFVHCQSKQYKTIEKKLLHRKLWFVKSNVEMRIAQRENECSDLQQCCSSTYKVELMQIHCAKPTTSDSFILSQPWISCFTTFSSCPLEQRVNILNSIVSASCFVTLKIPPFIHDQAVINCSEKWALCQWHYSDYVWPCNTVHIQMVIASFDRIIEKWNEMKTTIRNLFSHCGGMCQLVIEIKDITTAIILEPYLLINEDPKKMLQIIYWTDKYWSKQTYMIDGGIERLAEQWYGCVESHSAVL